MRQRQKEGANELAKERVERLFYLAEEAAAGGDLKHADRYVEMAWAIKLKFRVRLSNYQKKLFCRKCLRFLASPARGRYRTVKGVLEVKCLECGDVRRMPMSPKKTASKPISKPVSQARPR